MRDGKGEPYGALRYRAVDSVSEKQSPSGMIAGFSARPSALAIARGLPNGDDFLCNGNWPMMGSSGPRGASENGFELPPPIEDNDFGSCDAGWLYIAVAASTVDAPIRKEGVMWKSKSTTDARKDRMIDNDVAKPFRILSEYLITTAVTNPPKTCIATVAHAHPPKFRKSHVKTPMEGGCAGP